jgi:DNA-binding Lrp family transcriptional regulator
MDETVQSRIDKVDRRILDLLQREGALQICSLYRHLSRRDQREFILMAAEDCVE